MRDLWGGMAGPAQPISDAGEVARHALRDRLRRLGAFEMLRVGEDGTQLRHPGRRQQIIQGDRGRAVGPVDEVGVDNDRVDVADDQQRRVVERLAVLEQLLVGLVQVGVLALVLPAEEAALEDIRKTLPAAQLGCTVLEGEGCALGIRVGRRGVIQQPAEVEEMLVGRRALFERGLAPFDNEGLGGEGGWHGSNDTPIAS
jgi:hypothetical protein